MSLNCNLAIYIVQPYLWPDFSILFLSCSTIIWSTSYLTFQPHSSANQIQTSSGSSSILKNWNRLRKNEDMYFYDTYPLWALLGIFACFQMAPSANRATYIQTVMYTIKMKALILSIVLNYFLMNIDCTKLCFFYSCACWQERDGTPLSLNCLHQCKKSRQCWLFQNAQLNVTMDWFFLLFGDIWW